MKKKRILLIILLALIVIAFIGVCIYFVAGVSDTLPPIREYEYSGDCTEMNANFRLLSLKHSDIDFKVEGSVGGESRRYAYEGTITIKNKSDSLLYEVKWFNIKKGKFNSKLQLIGAHDLTNGAGGYGVKAVGMKTLLAKFNAHVLSPLGSNKRFILRPLQWHALGFHRRGNARIQVLSLKF